jgi:hypothetical protein
MLRGFGPPPPQSPPSLPTLSNSTNEDCPRGVELLRGFGPSAPIDDRERRSESDDADGLLMDFRKL